MYRHTAVPGGSATVLVCRRPLVVDPDGKVGGQVEDRGGQAGARGDHRWRVPGGRQAHLLPGRVHDRAQDRRHDVGLELAHLPVEAVQQLGGVGGVEGVGAQRVPQPPHLDRGGQPAADDVADHDAHAPRTASANTSYQSPPTWPWPPGT